MKATAVLIPLVLMLLSGGQAAAQSFDMQSAPVLKRAAQWREGRTEISMGLGDTFNTPYFHNVLVRVGVAQHLNNWLSVGGALGYGLPVKTALAEEIESKSSTKTDFHMPATHLGFMGEGFLSFIPFYGKELLLGRSAYAFDFHVDLGAAYMQNIWNKDADVNAADEGLFAPCGGAGIRVFVKDNIAIRLDVRDYLAKMQTHAVRTGLPGAQEWEPAPSEWRNNLVVALGISVFLPSEVTHEE